MQCSVEQILVAVAKDELFDFRSINRIHSETLFSPNFANVDPGRYVVRITQSAIGIFAICIFVVLFRAKNHK